MDKALIEIDGEACISRVINALNKAGRVPITISISNLDLIDSYSQVIDSSIEIEWSVDKEKFAGPIESIIENLEKFAGNEDFDETPQIETGFSPLHLAVINSANPSAIQSIVNTNPKCVHLKSSQGRTALDCAQFIVKQHWLYGTDDEGAVKNTFTSIEILEEAAINEKGE